MNYTPAMSHDTWGAMAAFAVSILQGSFFSFSTDVIESIWLVFTFSKSKLPVHFPPLSPLQVFSQKPSSKKKLFVHPCSPPPPTITLRRPLPCRTRLARFLWVKP